MTIAVSLLRGINVGGRNMVRMEALREIHESLGCEKVRTYVQSGNVVFCAGKRDHSALAGRIADAIERGHGFRPDVVLRTASELRDAIAGNPFGGRSGIEPGKLLVMFLTDRPAGGAIEKLAAAYQGPEEFHLRGRELYIYYPDGQGRSKLTIALIEKTLKTTGTGRNWNTVTKLLAMAEELS